MSRRPPLLPYLLLGPALLVEAMVHLIPAIAGVVSGFRRLVPQTLAAPDGAPFIGLDNYRAVISVNGPLGGELWAGLARSSVFTVLVVGVSWLLGAAAALLLADRFRGSGGLRVLFLLPFALPVYSAVLGWRLLFARDTGLINQVLVDGTGLLDERPFWLIGDNAFAATVIVAVWRLWPLVYLVLLAAVSTVDRDLHEAAALDGAGWWRRQWSVTRPAVRPTNAVLLVIAGLWTFNDFATPHLLFDGNPPEPALLLPNLIYRNAFGLFDLGIAAAANTVIALLLAVLAIVGGWLARAARRAADRPVVRGA